MSFRAKLLATLRAIQPVLDQPGVLVIGSEVPNLLQEQAASTLVVSQDVDIGVPVSCHPAVKAALGEITELERSPHEPSVWIPKTDGLIEVNFVGMDSSIEDAAETYVFEDDELPLLVFGPLSFLRPAEPIQVDGICVPVPRVAGLLMEKLVGDRQGDKGDRDLLVVMGLLLLASPLDLDELDAIYRSLSKELRYAVQSSLALLSLLPSRKDMPDPEQNRAHVAATLRRLDMIEDEAP